MAIQVSGTVSSSNFASEDLRLPAPIIKRNYSTAITLGGAAGQVAGHWRAFWVQLPAAWVGAGRRSWALTMAAPPVSTAPTTA